MLVALFLFMMLRIANLLALLVGLGIIWVAQHAIFTRKSPTISPESWLISRVPSGVQVCARLNPYLITSRQRSCTVFHSLSVDSGREWMFLSSGLWPQWGFYKVWSTRPSPRPNLRGRNLPTFSYGGEGILCVLKQYRFSPMCIYFPNKVK